MASKFTPERQQLILEALGENPSIPSAAGKAGISPVTLNRWLRQGEEGNEEFAEFALEASEARRTMKDEVVAALYKTLGVPVIPVAVKTDFQGNGKLIKDMGPVDPSKMVYFKFGEPMAVAGKGRAAHQYVVEFIAENVKAWGGTVIEKAASGP